MIHIDSLCTCADTHVTARGSVVKCMQWDDKLDKLQNLRGQEPSGVHWCGLRSEFIAYQSWSQ